MITPHQARYLAFQLTRRNASEDAEKLSAALYDAQVDLNPHQVESALFAFKSPLSKGALLADEVGLGKTIEAGLVLSQWWALGKKSLLIICPSNLRKQWQQELSEKFFLPSIILETRGFNKAIKSGSRNPFDRKKIIICSFQFARGKEDYLRLNSWDLVVIDEAHRLRNVYRPTNKIGNSIKTSLENIPKLLLTATPLQNSLLELYGLVSLIDERIFGDIKSFKSQFVRLSDDGDDFRDLKDRISPVCKRNLRRQVQEYISYTQRIPITIQFEPTPEEQALYDLVTEYLQRDLVFALPQSQRHLITLIMRKLLASSTFAISGTLDRLAKRLKTTRDERKVIEIEDEEDQDYEMFAVYEDDWEEENEVTELEFSLTEEQRKELTEEIKELEHFRDLAQTIEHNAKGVKLLTALELAFEKAREIGSPEKAIIFTESTRTQTYLYQMLNETAYTGKLVLFNGSNNDERSKEIYAHWIHKYEGSDRVTGNKTVDIRAALTDYFRDEASIMIATEAAAEGMNLQFCATVVNYDLPWNPQRIEQRIGRCHRYGQKHDVVVVNFVNVRNAADQRVYELLDQKFQLFSGVFGASDEVLGAIESGVDFERRIADIYQQCRTEAEIQQSFDALQKELEEQITNKMQSTRKKLLEHFDIEVVEKLKVTQNESRAYLNRFQKWLWELMKFSLRDVATFELSDTSFILHKSPDVNSKIPLGRYRIASRVEDDSRKLRIHHPLTQSVIKHLKRVDLPTAQIIFNASGSEASVSALKPYIGKSGWMHLEQLTVSSLDVTDVIVFTAYTDDGSQLSAQLCMRMLDLSVIESNDADLTAASETQILELVKLEKQKTLEEMRKKDQTYFQQEVIKLNKWADDKILAAEQAIRETKERIRELNRESQQTQESEKLLSIQKKLKDITRKQRRLRQEIFDVEDEIEQQRDSMIAEIEQRLKQSITETEIFTIRWMLI